MRIYGHWAPGQAYLVHSPNPAFLQAASPVAQEQPAARGRKAKLPDSRGVQVPESGTRVVTAGGRRRPAALTQVGTPHIASACDRQGDAGHTGPKLQVKGQILNASGLHM
jgi:hypothetical protein